MAKRSVQALCVGVIICAWFGDQYRGMAIPAAIMTLLAIVITWRSIFNKPHLERDARKAKEPGK